MTVTFKCSGTALANFAWYRRTKDSVPLFDPIVHAPLENSLPKILAELYWVYIHINFRLFTCFAEQIMYYTFIFD